MRFMREDEALKTMQLFEGGTEAKGISKRALKNWVVGIWPICFNILSPHIAFFLNLLLVHNICSDMQIIHEFLESLFFSYLQIPTIGIQPQNLVKRWFLEFISMHRHRFFTFTVHCGDVLSPKRNASS